MFSGCGFPAPGLRSFEFAPPFRVGGFAFTKPMLLALICKLVVIGFFWGAFARPKLVPRGLQNIGEIGLLFVRDQILRPFLGKDGDRYLPFLASLFFFIWAMNLMEVIPVAQFPVTSKIGFVWPLAAMVYLTYLYLGIKHQGPISYIRNMIPRDAPWWILPLLAPIEVAQHIVIQPFTLGVRLFANMFAGHLLLLVFSLGTWYLASFSIGAVYAAGSFLMTILVTALEVLVQFLQAFIFTTLTATYIAGSLQAQHQPRAETRHISGLL